MFPVHMKDSMEYDEPMVPTKKLKYILHECPICKAPRLSYCWTGMVHVARKEALWAYRAAIRAKRESKKEGGAQEQQERDKRNARDRAEAKKHGIKFVDTEKKEKSNGKVKVKVKAAGKVSRDPRARRSDRASTRHEKPARKRA